MNTFEPQLYRITGFTRQWVETVGDLALQTNDQVDRGAFDYAKWAKSMLNLFDFSLRGALDLAPDLANPGFPCLPCGDDSEPDRSEYITVDPDGKGERRLSAVPGSFRHDGVPSRVIPDHLLTVEPNVLKPLQTTFRIAVLWPELRSGTYQGKIRMTPEQGNGQPVEFPVTIDL